MAGDPGGTLAEWDGEAGGRQQLVAVLFHVGTWGKNANQWRGAVTGFPPTWVPGRRLTGSPARTRVTLLCTASKEAPNK